MKCKNTIAMVLAGAMLLPSNAFAADLSQYRDFPNDWSAKSLEQAIDDGLLNGSNGMIDAKGLLTRAQMAAIVSRAFGAAKTASLDDYRDVLPSAWYYSDMVLTVSAIKNDTSNPSSGNRIVVFTVTGSDINVGQSVTVSVGDKSANYDMIVPNTAIREDKNGTYILIITSKSTPLGNRYTATRVDVTKLASDDTNTAISCGIQGYETKPVSAGDLVRLPK